MMDILGLVLWYVSEAAACGTDILFGQQLESWLLHL